MYERNLNHLCLYEINYFSNILMKWDSCHELNMPHKILRCTATKPTPSLTSGFTIGQEPIIRNQNWHGAITCNRVTIGCASTA